MRTKQVPLVGHRELSAGLAHAHNSLHYISIIIPALNEAANISQCLDALELQTYPKDFFEIILVDNGSTDATIANAELFTERLPLRIVQKKKASISAMRNFGTALSKGTILAFLDADCFPSENWLQFSSSVARMNQIWGGLYLVPNDSTWVGRIWSKYQDKEQPGEPSFIPSGNLFIFRETFLRIGGFGENVVTSEDVDLCSRARAAGTNVTAFTQLAVVHQGTARTLLSFYRQNRWHGTAVVRVFLANLPSLKNAPLVLLSFYTLFGFWIVVLMLPLVFWLHSCMALWISLSLLAAPSVAISFGRVLPTRGFRDMPSLSVLYLTYLLARAASISHLSQRNHR